MPSRLQRQFHVTGTQYISTDKVQSQTLNTGGTAEDYFSPWANKPRAFFTIFYLSFITINYLHSQPSGYSHSASLHAHESSLRCSLLSLYHEFKLLGTSVCSVLPDIFTLHIPVCFPVREVRSEPACKGTRYRPEVPSPPGKAAPMPVFQPAAERIRHPLLQPCQKRH